MSATKNNFFHIIWEFCKSVPREIKVDYFEEK